MLSLNRRGRLSDSVLFPPRAGVYTGDELSWVVTTAMSPDDGATSQKEFGPLTPLQTGAASPTQTLTKGEINFHLVESETLWGGGVVSVTAADPFIGANPCLHGDLHGPQTVTGRCLPCCRNGRCVGLQLKSW